MLKEASTITMPTHGRLALQVADFLFRNSLPTRSVAHRTPAQSLEKFQSAQRCNRSRSRKLVNGKPKSVIVPPLSQRAGPGALPGARARCHRWGSAGLGASRQWCGDRQVGLAVGDDFLQQWRSAGRLVYALPNTDHPFFPQNLYRMSGGADNNERFEQIGQSWVKHAFARHRQTTLRPWLQHE